MIHLAREVRQSKTPAELVYLLGEVGAYGVNFHDNDLIPIDATPAEAEAIKKDFRKALQDTGLVVPMATTNLFGDPIFKDGAFTANDPKVRAYAIQKTLRAIDLGVEFGANLCLLGRSRRYGNRFQQEPAGCDQAQPRGHELPVRICARSKV